MTPLREIGVSAWTLDMLDKVDALRGDMRAAHDLADRAVDTLLSMRSLPCKCSTAAPGVSCERCQLGDLLEQVCEVTR